MTTRYLKNELPIEKSRHRMPAGLFVTRLAVLFALICVVATAVMLLG